MDLICLMFSSSVLVFYYFDGVFKAEVLFISDHSLKKAARRILRFLDAIG